MCRFQGEIPAHFSIPSAADKTTSANRHRADENGVDYFFTVNGILKGTAV
jgi:hypothetical protein